MQYLKPAEDPQKVIELLTPPHVPPNRKLFNNRFHALLGSMPKIDAQAVSQIEEVAKTVQVLEEIREGVLSNITRLDLPQVERYGFARVILAVEEPTERDGVLHSGTEVVLALWGEGFESPVHGHAAGYIHEDLLAGAFDVRLYEPFGPADERFARHTRTIEQRNPGIFYSEFVPDR